MYIFKRLVGCLMIQYQNPPNIRNVFENFSGKRGLKAGLACVLRHMPFHFVEPISHTQTLAMILIRIRDNAGGHT